MATKEMHMSHTKDLQLLLEASKINIQQQLQPRWLWHSCIAIGRTRIGTRKLYVLSRQE